MCRGLSPVGVSGWWKVSSNGWVCVAPWGVRFTVQFRFSSRPATQLCQRPARVKRRALTGHEERPAARPGGAAEICRDIAETLPRYAAGWALEERPSPALRRRRPTLGALGGGGLGLVSGAAGRALVARLLPLAREHAVGALVGALVGRTLTGANRCLGTRASVHMHTRTKPYAALLACVPGARGRQDAYGYTVRYDAWGCSLTYLGLQPWAR